MKIKRIIAAVTALMFIGGTYQSVSAKTSKYITTFAAETVEATSITEKGVRYNVYGDYATVVEVNGEIGCEILIADEMDGKLVTAIEKGAFDAVKDKVKSVTLGNNIQAVNERTFYEFSELTTVKFGDSVETIGNCAFAYCPKLESVTFGKNLTTIEKCAFFSCPSLVSLEYPDNLIFIDDFAFEMCTGISKVKFGKNLVRLGNCVFKDSSNITEVDLGEKLEYIGSAVFSGENLRCLVIPEKVKIIGQNGCPLYFRFSLKNRDTAIVIENPECKIDDYITY
ncbi:leucine-rich repeat domain-containing protein, partial [Ruminococcus sp.]|uniref:leucine-rich repeat domain-containing protein n=1 Tax=Ruminococcus sp. TaxID=41978 RepID=UPI0025E6E05F